MGHKFHTLNNDGFYLSRNWDFLGLTESFKDKSGGEIYDIILYMEANLPPDPMVKHSNRYCSSPLKRYKIGRATTKDMNVILGTFYDILKYIRTVVRRNPPDYVYAIE